MQVTKYYTNSDSKITHAEVSYTVTVGENTGTASAVVELREPLEEYTEATVLKSIAIRSRELDNLRASAKTKIVISDLTETTV